MMSSTQGPSGHVTFVDEVKVATEEPVESSDSSLEEEIHEITTSEPESLSTSDDEDVQMLEMMFGPAPRHCSVKRHLHRLILQKGFSYCIWTRTSLAKKVKSHLPFLPHYMHNHGKINICR